MALASNARKRRECTKPCSPSANVPTAAGSVRHPCSPAVRDQALMPALPLEFGLDGRMIPVTAVLLSRLLRSVSAVGAIALVIASLLEWGLITADPARLS